jgi:hypothetical protein
MKKTNQDLFREIIQLIQVSENEKDSLFNSLSLVKTDEMDSILESLSEENSLKLRKFVLLLKHQISMTLALNVLVLTGDQKDYNKTWNELMNAIMFDMIEENSRVDS